MKTTLRIDITIKDVWIIPPKAARSPVVYGGVMFGGNIIGRFTVLSSAGLSHGRSKPVKTGCRQ